MTLTMQMRKNCGGEEHLLGLLATLLAAVLLFDTVGAIAHGGPIRYEYWALDFLLFAWWHSCVESRQREAAQERLRVEKAVRDSVRECQARQDRGMEMDRAA